MTIKKIIEASQSEHFFIKKWYSITKKDLIYNKIYVVFHLEKM